MHRSWGNPEGPRQAPSHDVARTPGHRGRPQGRAKDAADPSGAGSTGLASSSAAESPRQAERYVDHFSAPLGSSGSGRLRFSNGAHGVAIRADRSLRGLYGAAFAGRTPAVAVRGGVVSIRYPASPMGEHLYGRPSCGAEVALNATIPWEIEVRGGVSGLLADLGDLLLGSLAIWGGVGRVEVVLPDPLGTVAIIVRGGASNLAIHRPPRVPTRLRVEGGATHLTFDDRRIGVAGGALNLRSRGYDAAPCRYDIAITGGANNVGVDQQSKGETKLDPDGGRWGGA